MIKNTLKTVAKAVLIPIFEMEAARSKRWISSAHKRLMDVQSRPPTPEFFDHHIDLFYQWQHTKNPLWLERGIFGGLALKGGDVLELACGDGFNTRNFYSLRSKSIIACDFDKKALRTAKKKNSADNIRFVEADIRTQMPAGKFQNVVWDAAIEHFTVEEIQSILKNIKSRLTSDGILSGYTLVEKEDGEKHLHQHEYEFKDMADLHRLLQPHFKNVKIFETKYPSRHNLYFWASEATVPFDMNWEQLHQQKH